jgi:GNAT superfamily N-acetyltransferase
MSIDITESSDSEYMKVARSITRFNLAHLPPNSSDNMTSLGYVMKDSDAGIIGGVYAKLLLGNCLSIDILWIEEKYRKRGYASQLMQVVEAAAIRLGSRLSIVDTFEFQAPDFYKKCGYELFGVLDDCPCIGNKRYYLKKVLSV